MPGADTERVTAWLRRLVALAGALDAAGHFADTEEIVVSAGGSAWFDAVAQVFGEIPTLSRPVLRLLRSGAYVSHDDGHYRRLTPSTGSRRRARCGPPSGCGRRSSPAPSRARRSSTRASGTPPATCTCRNRSSYGPSGTGRSGPPPASP